MGIVATSEMGPIDHFIWIGAFGRCEIIGFISGEIGLHVVVTKKIIGQKPIVRFGLSQLRVLCDDERHVVPGGAAYGE
jgi:hypothetical protein